MFYKFLHWIVTSVWVDWNHVFYNWKGLLSKEYTPLWECFSIFFFIRLSTSVRVDYKGIFTLDNVFYPKNVHLCASWLKWYFLHWKILFIWGIYTSVEVFCNLFSLKNYLPAIWLKWCLLHLKLFSTRRIYTFCAIWLKCLFLHLEMSSTQRICTSVRVF